MDGHHAIVCNPNWFIFKDNIYLAFSGPTEQFTLMSNCPWVQVKFNKPKPHLCEIMVT